MANLNFINIKDINCFISEVKKLHVHRQFSDECNDIELEYNEKVFRKEIEPTQEFFHLLEVIKNSNRDINFTKNRSKVMGLIIKLLPEKEDFLTFSSFSRTIT